MIKIPKPTSEDKDWQIFSHDLKNALTAIKANLYLLNRLIKPKDKTLISYLEKIDQKVDLILEDFTKFKKRLTKNLSR